MARCCGGLTLYQAVDAAEAAAAAAEAALAQFAVQPGIELGYAERITDYTTTGTNSTAGVVPTLSIDIVGTGRPVDVEIVMPSIRHSVASTAVVVALAINGSILGTGPQLGAVSSPSTTVGRTITVRRRIVVAEGVAMTLGAIIYGTAAGTSTMTGNGTVVNHISAVSR